MCGLEFPDLETNLWRPFRERGLQVVGVNPGGLFEGDSAELVARFVAQTGVTFPVGRDLSGSYGVFRGGATISPFPLDVVVDRGGRIAYVSRQFDPEALRAAVEPLLATPPPAP